MTSTHSTSSSSLSTSDEIIDLDDYDQSVEKKNMYSNLPLIFAGGYPTSLSKISLTELERFIPFMVQCSLGDIDLAIATDFKEPEWWPEDVPFSVPIVKPAKYKGNWFNKLKKLVAICYEFHNSIFLLRFCENLSSYKRESLRFINNYNHTTSLYDRYDKKLLVTFRNENMMYDKPIVSNKKTLLPRSLNSVSSESHQMVEQSLFEIFLCPNCEAELYSPKAMEEHEMVCAKTDSDDGDVIYCGRKQSEHAADLSGPAAAHEPIDMAQQQVDFLEHFQLFNRMEIKSDPMPTSTWAKMLAVASINNNNNNNKNTIPRLNHRIGQSAACRLDVPLTPDKPRQQPRRKNLLQDKCPAIPFASPAGQRVIKLTKTALAENYERERIDRYERFCVAPPLAPDDSNRPRFMDRKPSLHPSVTFRANSKHLHTYKYPRRQFRTQRRDADVAKFQQILLRQNKCVPLTVCTKRMSKEEIEILQSDVKRRKLSPPPPPPLPPQAKIDVIDLCSSDSDDGTSDVGDENSTSGVTTTSSSRTTSSLARSAGVFPLFVDCSIRNETITTVTGIDTIQTDAIFQSLITNSESIGYGSDELQQNKENHLMQFIAEQANAQARLASDVLAKVLNANVSTS